MKEDPELRDRVFVFEDRREAGRRLAERLRPYGDSESVVLAIPSGGVPVGLEVSERLHLPFDMVVVRKVHIPWNPEAGFGSVTSEGNVFLNEPLLERLDLSDEEVQEQVEIEKREIERRIERFRGGRALKDVGGETVILVDDGVASGFSMLAAVESVRGKDPGRLVVAVPTGPESSLGRIDREVDELICLNVRSGGRFAVAEAYENWRDLTDEDVVGLLEEYDRPPG